MRLSADAHNEGGCGVSDGEFGVVAGGERVEGRLLGMGEGRGKVELMRLGMNMY